MRKTTPCARKKQFLVYLKTSSANLLIIFISLQLVSCATPTPEPLAPIVTIDDLKNFSWDTGFTPLTQAQCLEVIHEPPVQEIYFDDTTLPVIAFGEYHEPDGLTASVQVVGTIGKNMFLQHAVACDIGDGIFQHLLLWKVVVKGPGAQNMLVSFTTSFDGHPTYLSSRLRSIQNLSVGGKWEFTIGLRNKAALESGDPLLNSLNGSDPIRNNLGDNLVIDEKTGSVPLRVIHIVWLGQ